MDRSSKDRMIKPLRGYMKNVDAMRDALENVPRSEGARRSLLMAKFEMLQAIHEITWLGLREEVEEIREIISDNPSAYLVDDNPSIGQNIDVEV